MVAPGLILSMEVTQVWLVLALAVVVAVVVEMVESQAPDCQG